MINRVKSSLEFRADESYTQLLANLKSRLIFMKSKLAAGRVFYFAVGFTSETPRDCQETFG